MTKLHVQLYDTHLGWLSGESTRRADFSVAPEAIARFGLTSTVLSESIPLTPRPAPRQAARRANVFWELLPEGDNRTALAAQAGVSPGDNLALLARYGRDVAGAIQLWDVDDPSEPRTPAIERVSNTDIAEMLKDLRRSPLGNSGTAGKTSLAGVQQKLVLAQVDGQWHRALGGYPSTHIVKVASPQTPTMLADEWVGHRLALALDLAEHRADLVTFDDVQALVVERFDRSSSLPEGRIHQEDMNQALGASGIEKYQRYGGVVNVQRMSDLLRRRAGEGDLLQFIRRMAFSVAIGDLDCHAKNISLLHEPVGPARLAPSYDTVPLAHQANDGELALSLGGEYRHRDITLGLLVAQWPDVRSVESTITMALEEVRAAATTLEPPEGSHPGIVDDIVTFCRNLLNGKPAGSPVSSGQ